jgi:antitoxin Phd
MGSLGRTGVSRPSKKAAVRSALLDMDSDIANMNIIMIIAKSDLGRRVRVTRFSLTDLSNRSGEIVEAAFRGPVEITRRGKRKFVLLTAEDYDRLLTAADTRQAFHADDASEEVAAMMLAALEDNDG